jgi:SAM-dependent methyltransferase
MMSTLLGRAREWVRSRRFVAQERAFHSWHYLRHTARRLEHLASLGLPVRGRSVLEVGAGVGDLTSYYLDRGCRVTVTDARPDNLAYLRRRFPDGNVRPLDLEDPVLPDAAVFDVIHCYSVLYHLSRPERALDFLARHCRGMLLLETRVTLGDCPQVDQVGEDRHDPTKAASGTGCRPTRPWVFQALRERFTHVYLPRTQPNHEEFPTDWTCARQAHPFARAVFVASRRPLGLDVLLAELPDHQRRHE